MSVRPASVDDAPAVAGIYNHYVRESIATFETAPLSVQEMAGRIGAVTDAGLPWLVLEQGARVRGYAYATAWKARAAYRRTVETTVYVDAGETGKGYGRSLLAALLDALERNGCHVALAGIALPNEASVRLHAAAGFTSVGRLHEVGRKFDRWIDVGYWQRVFP